MKGFSLITMLFLILHTAAFAQFPPVDTLRLNNAYKAVMKKPNTLEKQMEFISAFPSPSPF